MKRKIFFEKEKNKNIIIEMERANIKYPYYIVDNKYLILKIYIH